MTKARILLVGTAVLVGLAVMGVARGSTSASLPIPKSLALKVCPRITGYLERDSPGFMRFRSQVIRPRIVTCNYTFASRATAGFSKIYVTRVGRCVWHQRMDIGPTTTRMRTMVDQDVRSWWCVG